MDTKISERKKGKPFDIALYHTKEWIEAYLMVKIPEIGKPDLIHKCRSGRILTLFLRKRVDTLEAKKRKNHPLRKNHYTLGDLYRLGFSLSEIKTFLPEPDQRVENPFYQNSIEKMNLFCKKRVIEILQSEELITFREFNLKQKIKELNEIGENEK